MSTVGSLINRIRIDSLLALIRDLLATDHPQQRLAQLADTLAQQFALVPSEKHMIGRDLGRLAPPPSNTRPPLEENFMINTTSFCQTVKT
jgi:hypothetical protein